MNYAASLLLFRVGWRLWIINMVSRLSLSNPQDHLPASRISRKIRVNHSGNSGSALPVKQVPGRLHLPGSHTERISQLAHCVLRRRALTAQNVSDLGLRHARGMAQLELTIHAGAGHQQP